MKITEEIDWKILIADIECYKEITLFSYYNPDTEEWHEFEISEFKNDLLSFINFYRKTNWDYAVYFNGVRYDCIVLQWVISQYQNWMDLSNMDIVTKIYEYSGNTIDNSRHNLFPDFRDEHFEVPCVDVFSINGLDNAARSSSLKKIEFNLDWKNIEETPVEFDKENLTEEEKELIRDYNRNDILATYELFKLTLGQTEHPIYKGNNQVEMRITLEKEFNLKCMNYSEIKIGDELLKQSYAETKGIALNQIPRKGTFRKEIKLKDCIPSYVEFKTDFLKKVLKDLKSKSVKRNDDHEVVFRYGKLNTEYTIGLGGGHSTNKNQIWEEDSENVIIDLDVQSLYPAIICNEGYYPIHLGKDLLGIYRKLYERRIELKPQSKIDKRIKGICDGIKLILNSAYGKMGSIDSWMYDKRVPYAVCLTGQLNLLMLIEEMELNEIYCFSFNTDGATFKIRKDLLNKFYEIWKWWEAKTNLLLEESKFKKFYYSSVNDYFAVKDDDKTKKKGLFITDFELWKNKSSRIVALAVEEFLINKTDPKEFILNHKNIFDFVIIAKANGQLYLEMQRVGKRKEILLTEEMLDQDGWTKGNFGWYSKDLEIWTEEDEKEASFTFKELQDRYNNEASLEKIKLRKIVRYYLSKNSDWQMYKRGIGTTGKKANISTNAANDLGNIFITYYNQHIEKDITEYGIDYNQYIYKTLKIIDSILKTKKTKEFVDSLKPQTQLCMF